MLTLEVVVADITTLAVDAIVNAARPDLSRGSGVSDAIFAAAGPDLAAACAALLPCKAGTACVTPGFRLPARRIIHAAGPVWRGGGHREDALLEETYRAALSLAARNECRTIAFPAISTGEGGFPKVRASHIAMRAGFGAARDYQGFFTRIVFACLSEASARHLNLARGDVFGRVL